MHSPIRLLAVIEASTITGPAKNLLEFARMARSPDAGQPAFEVHIAAFQRSDASTLFLETARKLVIPVHPIPERGRFDRSVIAGLQSIVREVRPDILQSHAVKSHFLVRQAGIPGTVPWIAFHHGYTAPDLRARIYNQLDWWSLRAAHHAITVSQPFRRDLIRKGLAAERVSVVHNSVNPRWAAEYRRPETAAALRDKLGIPPAATVILLVGRFSSEKDHLTLLHALAELRSGANAPNAHLLLVGDGPERRRIEQTIRTLGLERCITLTGQVPSAEPYYGIADIAVLSSLSEGSPNALLEAMAAGIPAIATRVGGIPEIATDGESALLIAPRDRAAMTRALAAMATGNSTVRRMVLQAQEIVRTKYTPEARMAQLAGIYCTVLGFPAPLTN